MGVAKQLNQLQEIDLEIESQEQNLRNLTSQLGESPALLQARADFQKESERLAELQKQLHSAEWEAEDLAVKIKKTEEDLYGGRIRNPKELSGLQQETELFKAKRRQIEDRMLGLMEQIEQSEADVVKKKETLKQVEAEWRSQQEQLATGIEQTKTALAERARQREGLLPTIEPAALELYQDLRRKKGQAVARVEQGICRGCRISLSTFQLQRAKSGNILQCSSCGRILYLP